MSGAPRDLWGDLGWMADNAQAATDVYARVTAVEDKLIATDTRVAERPTAATVDTTYATKTELATKQNAGDYATRAELAGKQNVGDYATHAELATKQAAGDYATNAALATKQPTGDYATRAELGPLQTAAARIPGTLGRAFATALFDPETTVSGRGTFTAGAPGVWKIQALYRPIWHGGVVYVHVHVDGFITSSSGTPTSRRTSLWLDGLSVSEEVAHVLTLHQTTNLLRKITFDAVLDLPAMGLNVRTGEELVFSVYSYQDGSPDCKVGATAIELPT